MEMGRKPGRGRLAALLLAVLLLTAAAIPVLAAGSGTAGTETDPAPQVRVVVTRVDEAFLEVGLCVDDRGVGFQSVGALLTYDPAVLTPVDWAGNEVSAAGTSGADAAILPAKGAEELSGSLAEALSVDGTGYLFLSAESARTRKNYAQQTPDGEPVEGAPASTESGATIDTVAQADAAAEYAVVVRFRIADRTEAYAPAELMKALDAAAAAPAELSATFPLSTAPLTWLADNTDYSTAGETTSAELSFLWIWSGVSVNASGSTTLPSTDDFCTVVFYDWDGTLLGTRIVAKGGSLRGSTDLADCGNKADQAPLPPEGKLLWDVDGNEEYDFISNNNAGNDVKNKNGYIFAGWVDYFTGYSVPNVAVGAARGQKAQDLVSLERINEDLVLKAAYSEDASKLGPNAGTRGYLISYTEFVSDGGFLKTEITVRRPQNARRAVEGVIYLEVALQPEGKGQTLIQIPLGASDVETVEFRMPANAANNYDADALQLTVVDADGNARSAVVTIDRDEIVAH